MSYSSKYCSGCRADANEAVVILLPSNITVFTLDFSGSGLSDGEFVSLGWHEVCIHGITRYIHKENINEISIFGLTRQTFSKSKGENFMHV